MLGGHDPTKTVVGPQSLDIQGPRRLGWAWGLGNLAQICHIEFSYEVLDASEEMLAAQNADGDTPGNQSASPRRDQWPSAPDAPKLNYRQDRRIHRWTWQPTSLTVWPKL